MKRFASSIAILLLFLGSIRVNSQTCTPSTPVCVPSNGYAFQFAGDTDYGLKFNTTTSEYQFTNNVGNGLLNINAVNGKVTVENNMLVKMKLSVGLGNPEIAPFSVYNLIAQFGVPAGYAQFDPDGDLTFTGTSDFLVGGNKYAFRYTANENYGLYFNLSGLAYDFRGTTGEPLFSIGTITGNIRSVGTATIGSISQNDNLDRILVVDTSGLVQYRDASTLGGGGGLETDPQVGANTLNRVPKWNGSALVTGTISMESTSATGNFASSMGNSTQAGGSASTAMGFGTSAGSTASTAMGSLTTSDGWASTSLGQLTTASGDMSLSFGEGSTASAFASTAGGQNSLATGEVSTSIGIGTKARSFGEVVIGSFNNDYTPADVNTWNSNDRLFVIGNGASAGAPSNALTVLKNGKIGLGTDLPQQKLHLAASNLLVSGTNTSVAGVEIQPRLAGSNGGGRILFREFNSDSFGMSIGYNGANLDNQFLNWPADAFNIAFHTDDPVGSIAVTIPKNSGYVGIKTTAPTSELDVDGTVRVRSLSGTGIRPVFADSSGNLVNNDVLASQVSAPNSSIPDNSCAGLTNVLSLSGLPALVNSSDIRVTLNIQHVWLSDLSIYLTAPTGETLCLLNADGSNGDNLINTTFTDIGQLLSSGNSPFLGYFIPNGVIDTTCTASSTISSFSAIGGGTLDPNGNWTLTIFDSKTNDVGILQNWQISIGGNNIGRNNYVIKWQDGNLSQQSSIYDNGNVGIGMEDPDTRLNVLTLNSFDLAAVKAEGVFGPTVGYLGVQGQTSFDGNTGLDLIGNEIGVLGISSGASSTDNFGVYGYSNGWGSRFLHSTSGNYTDLGGLDYAIQARKSGNGVIGRFEGTGTDNGGIEVLSAGTGTAYVALTNDNSSSVIQHDGSNKLTFEVPDNVGRMTIDGANGNVGIGTYAPQYALTVRRNAIGITQESSDGATQIGFYVNSGSAWLQTHTNHSLKFTTNNGSTQAELATNGNFGIGSNPDNRLSVGGNANITGNLGVGITTASQRLSVSGNANITGNIGVGTTDVSDRVSLPSGSVIRFKGIPGNNQPLGHIRFNHPSWPNAYGGITAWQENGSDQVSLSFHTAYGSSTSSMFINQNGNVYVGPNGTAGSRFHVNHPSGETSEGFRLERADNSFWRFYTGDNGVFDVLRLYHLTNLRGAFNAASGVYTSLSDLRVKENIEDEKDVIDRIMQLKVKKYNFIADETKRKYIGLIAQETENIFPEFVHHQLGDGEDKYLMDYSGLGIVAIKAIQEQQKMIEEGMLSEEDKHKLLSLIAENEDIKAKNAEMSLRLEKLEQLMSQFNISLDECCAGHQSGEIFIETDQASLGQNIPNPFDNSTIIPYYIPENSSNAVIVITNMDGKEIQRFGIEKFGLGKISFAARDLAADTYMYSLFLDGRIIDTRMMILQ